MTSWVMNREIMTKLMMTGNLMNIIKLKHFNDRVTLDCSCLGMLPCKISTRLRLYTN